MIKYKYLLFLFIITINATPVVEVVFPGLLGNRLFVYCIGNIIAKELDFNLYSKPIYGFPNTFDFQNNYPSPQYYTEQINGVQDIDIPNIIANRQPRNIRIIGFFQRYKYLKPYTELIRHKWLKIDQKLIPSKNYKDIVLHIRTQNSPCYLPFEYYEKALQLASFEKLYICIDEPSDPYLDNFKKYNPIVVSNRSINQQMYSSTSWDDITKNNMDDFFFIYSFDKIIISHSTYSWWAAFLSDASEIYAPFSYDDRYQLYGKVEEPRYHYIDTHIGRRK